MMKKENPIVLTYGDATLRKSDQDNFKDGNWLTDNCISFFYEYLTHQFSNDEMLFLDPSSVAFMFFESELEDILDTFAPLKFGSRKYIFIPINDKEDKFQAVGGSHWALLVYVVEGEYFLYFDSSSGVISSIYDIAIKVYAVAHETTEPVDEKALNIVQYKNSPKQVNSYDCGMYTILMTESVAKWLVVDGKPLEDKPEEFEDLKPSFVTKRRKEIYELVNDLAVKKGKDKGF